MATSSDAAGLPSDVAIKPEQLLVFQRQPDTGKLIAQLQICNHSAEHTAAFKLSNCRSNAAALHVSTPQGVLQPGGSVRIQLHVLPRDARTALPAGYVGGMRVQFMFVAPGKMQVRTA